MAATSGIPAPARQAHSSDVCLKIIAQTLHQSSPDLGPDGVEGPSPGERPPSVDYDAVLATSVPQVEVAPLTWRVYFRSLPRKVLGGLDHPLPIPPLSEMIFSFVGAFISILAITAFDQWAWQPLGYPSTVASFGASAILLFGVPDSKLAQPRSFVGGQLISAVLGVALRNAIPLPWLAMPVCCAAALLLMQLTRSVHPPGGATALIAGGLNPLPRWRGWCFVVAVAIDCALMLAVALVSNNISARRHYPTYWWSGVKKAAV